MSGATSAPTHSVAGSLRYEAVACCRLIAHRPKGGRIADTGPGFGEKRFPPAQLADGRLCKRMFLNTATPLGSQAAAELAGADGNDWIRIHSLCRRIDGRFKALPRQTIQVRAPIVSGISSVFFLPRRY